MTSKRKPARGGIPGAGYRLNLDGQYTKTWADLGIELPPASAANARAFCPQCAGEHRTRSKTLSANRDLGVFQCFRCGWRGRIGGDQSNVVPLPPRRKAPDDTQRKVGRIRSVLSGCVPISDPVAEIGRRYLNARLGVTLDALPALGFHPSLAYFDTDGGGAYVGDFPALVATVRGVEGRLVTIHRTYIDPSGSGKARVGSPKKLMPPARGSVAGCAIRLYHASTELVLAEGIETALALAAALGKPAWATVSAHGLATVELPKEIRSVTIGADNDRSGAGQDAAARARHRLEREGRSVRVIFPPRQGQDWLDVLREVAA